MSDQPLDDDAELFRSLKPTRPEINWQKILALLPESSISQKEAEDNPLGQPTTTVKAHDVLLDLTGGQPRIQRLVSSWWSGALAGSLITFALLRFVGTQPVPNEPQDKEVARLAPSISTKSQRPQENSFDANSFESQDQNRPQRDIEGWDLIANSAVWSSRFKRHGFGVKLVSKSASGPTESIQTYESAPNSSDGFPKSQVELRRELLDFN